ncbi:hypothetical protein SFC43_08340 [Bacteroides sp. CR5/BHMF/2]|nr:hypothetical protein [Bacteroides sp. CR5/BHMF/2]
MMARIEVKPALPDGVTLTSVALLNVLTGSSVDLINQTATTKTDASASLSTITLMKAGDVYREFFLNRLWLVESLNLWE